MSYQAITSIRAGELPDGMDKRKIVLSLVGLCVVVAVIVVVAVAAQPNKPAGVNDGCPADFLKQPPLIVVSLDGFRATYVSRGLTPVLQEIADGGVSTPYMIPTYPTETFPNHYTIVTGLYPESHGIIANEFYDPNRKETFSLGNPSTMDEGWWLGEPMWNTLTRQGKKSATYFWPGAGALIDGMRPTYWMPYNHTVPFEDRVDQVLKWLQLPEDERPVWITLYFSEPDRTGHRNGPDSDEVNVQLKRMDGLIGRLISGLSELELLDCVNLIVLADHGMASGGPSWVVQLEDYIPNIYNDTYTFTGVFTRISPKDHSPEVKYELMRNLTCKRPDMRQYEREGLPTRFHFSNNIRIEDIVLDFDAGRTGSVSSTWYSLGNHGYDNYFSAMHALFLAHGPSFKTGVKVPPFQNLQLYNLMCHLTGVDPAPNNGTWGALNYMLEVPAPVAKLPTEKRPRVAKYPKDAMLRSRLGVSGCPGDLKKGEAWLSSLKLSHAEQEAAEAKHLPWGIPLMGNLSAAPILLHHQDHVTAYSEKLKMPLWTSFTLTSGPEGTAATPNWSSDVRLHKANSVRCDDYDKLDNNTIMAPLFPPEFSLDKTLDRVPYIVSNAAPSTEQQQKHWRLLLDELMLRWLGGGQLNVILGPAFDLNADSIVDNFKELQRTPELPSDWFAVVIRCLNGGVIADCDTSKLESRAFIFPTVQVVENCQEGAAYSLEFSSRIQDVEIITGLTLYPTIGFDERIRLITAIHNTLW